jgi:branched-chain amino acid transport system ATP-binding protein
VSSTPLFEAKGLVKRYGQLTATQNVSLSINEHEIHALIGPNGAGKTTLIGQLSGQIKSDSGEVYFKGEDITPLRIDQRVKKGVVRSYQITRLFKSFTCLDNVALAVQARKGSSFSFWQKLRKDQQLRDESLEIVQLIGLTDKSHVLASDLSHAEQRILELGVAYATHPQLLLLDEPMAGTGPQESELIISLIEQLKSKASIFLIEHDMDTVFRLADRISVLVNGAVIATGTPQAIRSDPNVIAAYLGDEHT